MPSFASDAESRSTTSTVHPLIEVQFNTRLVIADAVAEPSTIVSNGKSVIMLLLGILSIGDIGLRPAQLKAIEKKAKSSGTTAPQYISGRYSHFGSGFQYFNEALRVLVLLSLGEVRIMQKAHNGSATAAE